MRKRWTIGRFCALAAVTFATFCCIGSGMASAEIILKYSPWLPPDYVLNEPVLFPWMKEIEKVTEGRVKVEFLPKAVGTPPAQFDVVRDGLADLVVVLPGYTPGRFDIMKLGELPALSDRVDVLNPAFYHIYDKHLSQLDLFRGTHVLTAFLSTPTHLVTNRPIKTIDDLRGLKFAAPSSTLIPLLEALKTVPLVKGVSELYELASGKMIDGSILTYQPLLDWHLADSLPYMTLVPGGLGQSVLLILVNKAKWDALEERDQEAISKISGEALARAAGATWAEAEVVAARKLKDESVTISQSSDDLAAAVQRTTPALYEEWISSAEQKGVSNPREILEEFRSDLQKGE